MCICSDGTKLSKRQGDIKVEAFQVSSYRFAVLIQMAPMHDRITGLNKGTVSIKTAIIFISEKAFNYFVF